MGTIRLIPLREIFEVPQERMEDELDKYIERRQAAKKGSATYSC